MSKSTKVIQKYMDAVESGKIDPKTDLPPVVEKTIEYKYDELLEEHKTKSGMIRFLASKEFSRGQIAKFMGIKYQFVRNVLIQPVKKTA